MISKGHIGKVSRILLYRLRKPAQNSSIVTALERLEDINLFFIVTRTCEIISEKFVIFVIYISPMAQVFLHCCCLLLFSFSRRKKSPPRCYNNISPRMSNQTTTSC